MTIAVVNDSGNTGSNWILWRRVWPANTVDSVVRVVSVMAGQLCCAFSSRMTDKIQGKGVYHGSSLPECQDVPVPTHVLPDLLAHAQAKLLAPQQNLSGADRAASQEDSMFRMNPHQVAMEVCAEVTPVAPVPGEIHVIATALTALLNISDLAFTEHLGAPVPCVGEVGHQRCRFGPVVDARGILAGQGRRDHFHSEAIGPISEARCLIDTRELVGHSEVLGLLLEQGKLRQHGPVSWVWLRVEDLFCLLIVCKR